LSAERAAEEAAAAQAAIAAKLAALQSQAQQRQRSKTTEQRSPVVHGQGRTPVTGSGGTGGSEPRGKPGTWRVLVDPASLVLVDPNGTIVSGVRSTPPDVKRSKMSPLPDPRPGGGAPSERSTRRAYTDLEKETLGLQLVRDVLGSDAHDMVDLRAQHGVGADAIDELRQFYELKVYSGPEPDHVVLEDSQIRRAMSTNNFFLVVVSGIEGEKATPRVRVIVDPLAQLRLSEQSQIKFFGVRQSHSLVYNLMPQEDPSG
jgi:hypothetical protein